MPQVNAAFNHIAISVPDAEAAVQWYTEILGFRVIVPVTTRRNTDAEGADMLTALYGPEMKEMKLAILSTGNDVGVEIFEFVDPPYNGPAKRIDWDTDTYTQGGVFHFCFTVADVDETLAKALTAGARSIGGVLQPVPGIKCCYLQDPWGNTIELLDTTINQLFLTHFQCFAK
ncbi:glyoxalase family, partial [Fusarium pseudoanthophilum]